MSEKYLGEQGLAKLIELVKKNSGGSRTYIKQRTTTKKSFDTTITNNTLHSFIVSVKVPIGTPNILVQVWFTGTESYTTFSQVCAFQESELWITEVYGIAHENSVSFYARLQYIGSDENKINSGEFTIMDIKKFV